jgi:predicted 2-oxoglutarate/Fe(II)-dependent dioxygenase YbiX
MTTTAPTKQLVYTARIDSIDHRLLASKVGELRSDFSYSPVLKGHQRTHDLGRRNSLSLNNLEVLKPYTTQILLAVKEHWPKILKTLGINNFIVYQHNMSCVAYEDGGFFKRHKDFSPFSFYPRRLTWIYYFFKEPKGFEGGDLVFYDREEEKVCITPSSGLLVAFGPQAEHEATTVTVSDSDFKSSRFSFTCFVTGFPTLQSAARSTLYQFDARFPNAHFVTRPLIRVARKIIHAPRKNNDSKAHQ